MSRKHVAVIGVLGATLVLGGAVLLVAELRGGCCAAFAEQRPAKAAETALSTAALDVDGMSCSACTVTVRLALKQLDGVKDATVSLDDKRAAVEYDPGKVSPRQMAEAVTKAGYKATVVPEEKGA